MQWIRLTKFLHPSKHFITESEKSSSPPDNIGLFGLPDKICWRCFPSTFCNDSSSSAVFSTIKLEYLKNIYSINCGRLAKTSVPSAFKLNQQASVFQEQKENREQATRHGNFDTGFERNISFKIPCAGFLNLLEIATVYQSCLLYTSPSPRDRG